MRSVAMVVVAGIVGIPLAALAFPFGGQASIVKPCYNDAIYVMLGAPRGGPFIWTPSTKTYQFGPPTRTGQWLLGLAGAPYYCIVSIEPLDVWPGTDITMMGSSGPSAPPTPPQSAPTTSSSPQLSSSAASSANAQTSAPSANSQISAGSSPSASANSQPSVGSSPSAANSAPTSLGHVLISEVFYSVDPAHGTSPANQWVELYNDTSATVNFSGWVLENTTHASPIPSGTTLSPGQFLVVVANSNTPQYWSIPASARVVALSGSIDAGLSATGDYLTLKNSTGGIIDAVSWGTNVTAFNPSVPAAPAGHSTARINLTQDSNTASDWTTLSAPTPGTK